MTLLCYSTKKSGVHLTADGHRTLCGIVDRKLDIPTFPRVVEALSCDDCRKADDALYPPIRREFEEVRSGD